MAFVEFSRNGYEYYDDGEYLLFSADNTHDYLFNYIFKDLSSLPKLFEQYVSKQINIRTLELNNNEQIQYDEISEMKDILTSAHPYCMHEYKNIIIQAIGDYFNELLLYLCCYKHTINLDFSRDWYINRITKLLTPLLAPGDSFPTAFYDDFLEQTGQKADTAEDWESIIINFSNENPIGFKHEIQTQKNASNMLYLILDISAPELDNLTLSQRAWMHDKLLGMQYPNSKFRIPMQRSFCEFTKFHAGDRSSKQEQSCKLADIFNPLLNLSHTNIERDGIPSDMMQHFSSAIEFTKAQMTNSVYTQYEIDSLQQLLYLEIMLMIQDNTMIRKCRRCGKYFVVNNRKIAYCDRVDENGLRCSAVGSQQNFQKKMKSDEPLKIYNRAYKTHFARLKKGTMSQDTFRLWCDEAKSKLTETRAGQLDIASFQNWLKK